MCARMLVPARETSKRNVQSRAVGWAAEASVHGGRKDRTFQKIWMLICACYDLKICERGRALSGRTEGLRAETVSIRLRASWPRISHVET